MNNKIAWTIEAKKKKDDLILGDSKLRNYFAATEQSLKNGEFRLPNQGTAEIDIVFTSYKLVLEIDSDRIAKIKYIDIIHVK